MNIGKYGESANIQVKCDRDSIPGPIAHPVSESFTLRFKIPILDIHVNTQTHRHSVGMVFWAGNEKCLFLHLSMLNKND